MKKQFILWLAMFLTISLSLPSYSLAQTTLTLESYTTGDRISGPNVKYFSLGEDGKNLVIFIDGPFTSKSFSDIWVDNTPNTYENCKTSPPASVVATQPAPGLDFKIKFMIKSSYNVSMIVPPYTNTANGLKFSGKTFEWNIGGSTPVPVGSYLAVFQAENGTELVVTIKINSAEIVTSDIFTVSVVNNTPSGGSVVPSSQDVQSGGTANFTVTPNTGYYVSSYTAGILSGNNWTISNVTSDINASITFTQQPTTAQGELIEWNIGKYTVNFQPNQTKTFIARIEKNSSGVCARRFEIHFNTMGVTVSGTFRMDLKEDGTPYITRWGTTEWLNLYASNEGSVDFDMSVPGDILNSPCIYPGDFVLTLTSGSNAGFGYMRAAIYYP